MDGYVNIEVDLSTQKFEKQIEEVEDELKQIDYELSHKKELNLNSKDIKEYELKEKKLINKLKVLKDKQDALGQDGISNISKTLNNISDGTSSVIKKVTRWGLAIFSVRSAYMFIRQSMGVLSQYNEQMATDLEYIRWSLAVSLEPIITTIIDLAYKLLGIINSISMAIFNYNIFANASVDAFKKQKQNLKGANREARELKKTLAGFDEMNILQDDGSISSGGGGGGIGSYTPPQIPDFSKQAEDFKSFWNGIFEFWDKDWEKFFGSITGHWDTFWYGIGLTFKGVFDVFSGVGEMIIGIFDMIIGVFTGNMDKVKEGFGIFIDGLLKTIKGAWEFITGILMTILGAVKGLFLDILDVIVYWVGEAVGLVTGFFEIVFGSIGGIIDAIGRLIFKEEDERVSLEKQKAAAEALKDARDKLSKAYDNYADAVENAESKEKALKDIEEKTKLSGKDLYEQVLKNYNVYKDFSPEQRKVYQAYVDNINAQERLQTATENVVEQKNHELDVIGYANRLLFIQGEAYNENFQALVDGLKTGETSWEDFARMVSTLMAGLTYEEKIAFTKTLPDDVREGTRKIFESLNSPFSKFFTQTTTSAKNLLSWFDKIKNSINNISGRKITFSVGGVSSGNAKGGIVTKLATGGIVNRPGRGIPVASSYMGEAGREGILPLTDAQAMETLGQAIGRYISINATVPVYMGNRMVAREIKKIEAESDFSYNR